VDEKIIGVLYAVYEGQALRTSTDEAEIIYVTKNLPKVIEYANKHKGVVYSYDVTQQEDCINETVVYDGTKA
jgi:hypothetical protein